MTEAQLTDRLKSGDNEARAALYERYAPAMMSLCLRYLGNRPEAEDALHDGFLHVFDAIGKFKPQGEGSLGAWLRRVFTNYAVSLLRERQRGYEDDAGDDLPDMTDEEPPPPGITADVIVRLIGELPPGYRTVLNLYLIEGRSHAEIAALLHIGESTSASQYLRAKKMLRQKITHYLQTHEP